MFRYSDEMISFLRAHRNQMTLAELTKKFNEKFGQRKSTYAIHRICYNKGLCQKIRYRNDVKEFIKHHVKSLSYKELTEKINTIFNLNKSVNQIKGFCIYHDLHNGKGKKVSEQFYFTDDMIQYIKNNITQTAYKDLLKNFNEHFSVNITKSILKYKLQKLGLSNGRTPDHQLFTEHFDKRNGYFIIKTEKGWISKQRFLWEQYNGPLSEEYCIIFADGDITNFTKDNLIKVNRKEHFHLNRRKLRFSDPEYTKTGLNIVKLFLKAEERQKEINNEESEKENQQAEA
ncbi:HNH endonuclease [Desulfovibrio sp. SGI.169]|uniref:HNH endonuclease n=1 Tax=Desulfovibrio sp. SGI.169 TaxID=3420561 RepID=UPI003CFDB482